MTILDLDGLTAGKINQRALNFVKLLTQTGQNYYPGALRCCRARARGRERPARRDDGQDVHHQLSRRVHGVVGLSEALPAREDAGEGMGTLGCCVCVGGGEVTPPQVEILGGREAYLPRLLTIFDIDAIPVEYGGRLVVPGGIFPTPCVRALYARALHGVV